MVMGVRIEFETPVLQQTCAWNIVLTALEQHVRPGVPSHGVLLHVWLQVYNTWYEP